MFSCHLYEKRPLKKPRIGPPDVYPQEPKQKEDELTLSNVKHGFPTMTHLSDEFGTARNCNVTASKVGAYFNAINNRKEELSTMPESGGKRQKITPKDNFWPATIRTKNHIEAWFKDLAGNKPLMTMSKKKAPNFNKKEEIFMMLTEYQVPMMRAAWFIKLSSAYTVAVSEAKIKKRQMSDPTTEWTSTLLKFLKDQVPKLQEFYSQTEKPPLPPAPMGTLANNETEQKLALRHWTYCCRLLKYMNEEGLMDRQEVLVWIIELLEKHEKPRNHPQDDGLLRLFLPLTMQYLDEFVQSELLSRRLCHFCSKKLNFMLNNVAESNILTSPPSESKTEQKEVEKDAKKENMPSNPLHMNLNEYQTCQHHKDIVLQLSTLIQTVVLECPTALVWCSTGVGTQWHGSPLDNLPISPSTLPMPPRCDTNTYLKQIRHAENCIRERSKKAEWKWCADKFQCSAAGTITTRVLAALDALDRHRFDKMDSTNSLDTLYAKVFSGSGDQENAIVKLLCEWAVSPERTGEHRALAVAALLDRRQSDTNPSENQEATPGDDKESNGSLPGGPPMFQSLLMKFLDVDAPIPGPDDTPQKKIAFSNLVHLFAELIRRDVFSHDAYMCTLIARGDLIGHEDNADSMINNHHPKIEPMDYDDADVDNDLDKILQNIKEEQHNSMDIPDSPKDHDHGHHPHVPNMGHVPMETGHGDHKIKASRHFLYSTHFPLCQDDPFSQHDCNQRHILLYGVGKVRDEARHTVKKMSKEICKLFSKKFSVDVAEGGKVKKHSRNEFNFEATTQKCQSLSYFDQHVVTWQCSVTVIEMLNSFATGNSNYLPVQEHVAFLFDLMELALNIYGLIDVCIQILKELPEVENQLYNKNSVLSRNYTTGLSLYVVGVLRRYHCCLLLSSEQTSAVFEGLCKVVKHVTNPGDCSSAERCILAHLYDLYSSCSLLKSKPHAVEPFGNAYPKIKQALYSSLVLQPTSSTYVLNSQFMQEIFKNPRRVGRIESTWAKQLNESANNRYSFVCNAVIRVCCKDPESDRLNDNEKLNDLAILCAEMTACCNTLASEWLGVLLGLCSPTSPPEYYKDVLNEVKIEDVSIHNSLAVFTCILIARHCFSLEDFVRTVALPSLLKVKSLDSSSGLAEAGMRLTCHLLLRLFRTAEGPQPGLYSVGSPPLTSPRLPLGVRLSCDRHLLAAAHRNIDVGPVLAVLKAVLIVGDATAKQGTEPSLSNILGTSDLHSGIDGPSLDIPQLSSGNPEGTASLSAFANHVLREICSQQWVLDRCLCHPEKLCDSDNLLDDLLTHSQAQRLLHMICYPEIAPSIDELDQKTMISRILENLELWTLRMSWLDLQLMFKQYSVNTPELSQWLDTVAKAAIDVFQLNAPSGITVKSEDTKKPEPRNKTSSIWLVAPLIAKLSGAVQGRVLKVAGQVLESGGWHCKDQKPLAKRTSSDSQSSNTHQPFLSLVLTCLKGQEEGQKEGLLSSLHQQLTQLVQQAKEGNLQDTCHSERTLDGLQLRFALVGGVFEAFQRNSSATTDWALLLVQLVTHGIIDLHTNSELFTTIVDMLATLVHSALAADTQDDGKKMHQNLMKKIKKEIGERQNMSLMHIRQLLPLPRLATEVIAVEPAGSITDSKGNKINFDSVDKKHDLSISDKQRVSSWDILEGMKNPPPLSWAWFGAVRLERKPLMGEDTHRLLKFHTHNLQKPASYYLDPPPLPPEDLEPIPDKVDSNLKADTPSSVDQSPAALGKGRGKGQRKRKPKPGPMNVNPMMGHNPMGQGQPGMGVGMQGNNQQMGHTMGAYAQNPGMQTGQQYGGNPGQQWYGQNPNTQQGYGYPPMAVNRFERPQLNPSKQALSNMLRQRHPINNYGMPGIPNNQAAATPNPGYGQMPRFPRQAIRQQHPAAMQSNQGMFPNQYGNMQSGMGNQYGNFPANNQMMQGNMQNNPQMMQASQGNMFAGQQQSFGQPRPAQPDFRQMPGNPRAPYMQQAPNVTMNTNMSNMGGMSGQGGPAPPYSRPAQVMQPGVQNQQATFQQQQQRIRQQMMALQQQQQQQGGPGGNQPSPALVAHLQRQQMNPQAYHQPPPYNMQ